jgi:hypothetical protein
MNWRPSNVASKRRWAAIIDEYVNTWMLDNGKIKIQAARKFLDVRPLLEIAAFSLSFLTGE